MAADTAGARRTFVQAFRDLGLGSLAEWAWQQHLDGLSLAAIKVAMVDTPEFQARFPAYHALAKRGEAMTIPEMLQYEKQARDLFHAAALPRGFYDTPADFAKFMVGRVSLVELQSRVSLAQQASLSAPEVTRKALGDLYGVKGGDLVAVFLDAKKALPVLTARFAAAEVAGAAGQVGFGLDRKTAERLGSEGIGRDQALAGFSQIGEDAALLGQTAGETGADVISTDQAVAATFEGNAAAKARIEKKRAERLARFGGSAGYGAGKEGVAGLGKPA